MKIKRSLPPPPPTATKQVRNDHIYGFGRHTYEYNESAPALDLQIPPTRSDSKQAEAEREMKIILDLARQGKTASEIEAETGYPRRRITLTVMKFAEYGAKLAPEQKKKRKATAKATHNTKWTDEMIDQLIELHRAGLTFSQIGRGDGTDEKFHYIQGPHIGRRQDPRPARRADDMDGGRYGAVNAAT